MQKPYNWEHIVDKVQLPTDPNEKKYYEYAIDYFAIEYKGNRFTESEVTRIVEEIIEEANHKLQLSQSRKMWLESS